MQMGQGPICQSCAMPMDAPEQFGTDADGSRSQEYCVYCYQRGSFTGPDTTLEGMIEFCADIMAEKTGMGREQAKAHLNRILPKLRRWQGAA